MSYAQLLATAQLCVETALSRAPENAPLLVNSEYLRGELRRAVPPPPAPRRRCRWFCWRRAAPVEPPPLLSVPDYCALLQTAAWCLEEAERIGTESDPVLVNHQMIVRCLREAK